MILFGHLGLTLVSVKAAERYIFKRQIASNKVILIGSVLPDLIDKFIRYVFFNNSSISGRLYAHTLIFLFALVVVGFIKRKYKWGAYFLLISSFVLLHDIFDQMYLYQEILFWPYYGWGFPHYALNGDWLTTFFNTISKPTTFLPEIIGLLVLVIYFKVKA